MKKSFIERIFPVPPGNTLPQYEDESPVPSQSPPSPPPRILLRESATSSTHSGNGNGSSALSSHRTTPPLTASLVRYDDPFLPVERAAKALERTLQSLLDAQSEGLLAGVGAGDTNTNDASSTGSLTPTPSLATAPQRHVGAKTVPIRQPKSRKVTLRGARRGLVKSMAEFARLKEWESTLIDHEVAARENALKRATDLETQRQLLQDEMDKITTENGADGLRAEAQTVEQEILHLETKLLELKSRHRQLVNRAREIENSRDARLSSYAESLRLNDDKVKLFLRKPPVRQGLSATGDAGMYALKPDRRTLHMAEEQWTAEVGLLHRRKSDVESEKQALEEGLNLWQQVVDRVNGFEKELRTQTKDLSRSQLQMLSGDAPAGTRATTAMDVSLQVVLAKLRELIAFLQEALSEAESKNWNLLICSIGAELAAFQQAREVLQEIAGVDGSESSPPSGPEQLIDDDEREDIPNEYLASGSLGETNGTELPRSPGESSNRSLEDTLREFGRGTDKGKQKVVDGSPEFQPRPELEPASNGLGLRPRAVHDHMSESEDDEPGPEFLLSHT